MGSNAARKVRGTIDALYSGTLMLLVFFLSWVLIFVIALKILSVKETAQDGSKRKLGMFAALSSMLPLKPAASRKPPQQP